MPEIQNSISAGLEQPFFTGPEDLCRSLSATLSCESLKHFVLTCQFMYTLH